MPNMAQFRLMEHEHRGWYRKRGHSLSTEGLKAFLGGQGLANKSEVAFAFGVTYSAAYRALKRARNEGVVELVGSGPATQYQLIET
jgi:hypothetical protein